jgi:DNA polymerase-3 subunit beta
MLHVELSRKALRPLVKATATVSKPSDNRPILRNVLITATEESLEISATNMVVSLWLKIPVGDDLTVHKTGKVVVPSLDLLRVLETSNSDRLDVENKYSRCHIKGAGSKFALVTEDPRDFPNITRFSTHKPFVTISGSTFSSMLDRSVYCAHDERSFFLMHGLLVKAEDQQLHLVATNGQRLGVCTNYYDSCSREDGLEEEIVIPSNEALNLKKVCADKDAPMDIQWVARSLNVRGPRGEVCILALNGTFPDYRRGIPNNSKKIEFDRERLIKLLSQTQVFKGATTTLARAEFSSQRLSLVTLSPDIGEARLDYEIDWEHDNLKLVVNPEFLLATAKAMRSEKIEFEVEGEMVQTLMREQRDDNMECFCVYAVARQ